MVDQEAFDVELLKLNDTHKEAIDKQEELQKEYNALIEEEVEIKIYPIRMEWFPKTVKSSVLESLMDFIED